VSDKELQVRHLKRRAQVVNTRFGEVALGGTGEVTNLDDLECTAEELCEFPNFVDVALFAPGPEAGSVVKAREDAEKTTEKAPSSDGPSDEDYGDIIAELIDGGAACTSEGYIQMDVLNAALREKDLPTISGTKRKEISDAYNAD